MARLPEKRLRKPAMSASDQGHELTCTEEVPKVPIFCEVSFLYELRCLCWELRLKRSLEPLPIQAGEQRYNKCTNTWNKIHIPHTDGEIFLSTAPAP